MVDLTLLKGKDISVIRDKILNEDQNGCCALCTKPITEKSGAALDHQHRTKSSVIGEDGGGLIRGVLCRACNLFEGKIWNSSKRFGMHDDLISWLRRCADYLEKENYNFIHPSEVEKDPPLSKKNYNKLKKLYDKKEFIPKRKNQKKPFFPEFPKSKKLTVALKKLFEEFEISPYN